MKEAIQHRPRFLWAVAIGVLLVTVAVAMWSWRHGPVRPGSDVENPTEGLQLFGIVPDFFLVERSGRKITLADLEGKIWIANFIYTHCPDTCPMQSAQMKALQDEFKSKEELRLVSITVDPDRDTPEVLTRYAEEFGADPLLWLFLTGDKEVIYRLAQQGFRLGASEIAHEHRPASGASHTHSPRFVLVDESAQIRGYYSSGDAAALERLRQHLRIVLDQ